jgi:type IV pilus assembly protein PilC
MANFNYRARDNTGKSVKGVMAAATKDEVAAKLRKMGYAPVAINEGAAALNVKQLGRGFTRISTEDIVMFNVQLSNMINSGLDIMSSLQTLQKQIENKRLKAVIEAVGRSVEGGESFSRALERHPAVFSSLFVSMVNAGEASGNLDKVLTRHAEFAESQADLQQKVSGALFYPAVLITAALQRQL